MLFVLSFCSKRKNQRKAAGNEKIMALLRTSLPELWPKAIIFTPFPVLPTHLNLPVHFQYFNMRYPDDFLILNSI